MACDSIRCTILCAVAVTREFGYVSAVRYCDSQTYVYVFLVLFISSLQWISLFLSFSYFAYVLCTLDDTLDLFQYLYLTFINLKILPLPCDIVVSEFSGRLCYGERSVISRSL